MGNQVMSSSCAVRESLFRAAAIVALLGAVASPAWAQQDQAAQQIHDRLVGKQAAPAAPATATSGAKCDTAAEIENDPACAASVSGPGRPWSLTGHVAPAHAARAAAAAAPAHASEAAVRTASARRTKARGAATACDLDQAGEARSVNLCLTFALNSATLTPTSRASLDSLATALAQSDVQARKVLVGGYADATGNARHNLKLSSERAQAAVAYLVAHGVAADRLESKGYGETHPLPGHSPKDPANRRVEAVLAN